MPAHEERTSARCSCAASSSAAAPHNIHGTTVSWGAAADSCPSVRLQLIRINEKKIINVVTGSMVLFPASLMHYTIPFESKEERIVLAFDVKEK